MDPLERWRENPFFVLGIAPSATEVEIERQGARLLAELELGLQSAKVAHTPLGALERSRDRVRAALAELRVPERRAHHALWAALPAEANAATPGPLPPCAPWPDAMSLLGFRSV
jgi:hypothetical protein